MQRIRPLLDGVTTLRSAAQTRAQRGQDALRGRFPVLAGTVDIARETDLVDRAAALALFCMLAFVPAMFGVFSALGYIFEQIGSAAEVAGLEVTDAPSVVAQITKVIQEALPGVTWDPSALANALVKDRAANGAVSSLTALVLGLTLFSRIDNAIRVVFGRRRRSAFRAAGIFGLFFLIGSILALFLSVAAPLTDWGLQVAAESMSTLSLGWVDGVTMVVAATQTLPIVFGFYALVRWSAGRRRVARRRVLVMAFGFGGLWFIGQRLFSLYVGQIIRMDAIYGALTGVVALMLWLYYASLAFLLAVSFLASWERRLSQRQDASAGTLGAEADGAEDIADDAAEDIADDDAEDIAEDIADDARSV